MIELRWNNGQGLSFRAAPCDQNYAMRIYCSIWNKSLLISINDILLLNEYKPASVGEFLVSHQREFDKCLAQENTFSGLNTQIKHPQNAITQFLLSPLHH